MRTAGRTETEDRDKGGRGNGLNEERQSVSDSEGRIEGMTRGWKRERGFKKRETKPSPGEKDAKIKRGRGCGNDGGLRGWKRCKRGRARETNGQERERMNLVNRK